MLEGKLTLQGGAAAMVVDPEGVALADGIVCLDSGAQGIAGDAISSALRFIGTLTDAGRAAVKS